MYIQLSEAMYYALLDPDMEFIFKERGRFNIKASALCAFVTRRPVAERSIVMRCLPVCPLADIFGTTYPSFTKFSAYMCYMTLSLGREEEHPTRKKLD